jgi:GNAT superfamily N-acetyltransferase
MPHIKHTLSIAGADDGPIASLDVVVAHSAYYIVNVYVSPDAQGQGYARALLECAVQTFGCRPLYVHALPYADRPLDEAALMALYARFGFQPTPGFPGGMWRPATQE